jgi:hypothetical protein
VTGQTAEGIRIFIPFVVNSRSWQSSLKMANG